MEDGCRWSCELFIKRVESRKSGKHGDMRVISRMNSDEFVTKLLRGSYDLTMLHYIEGLNGGFFFCFFEVVWNIIRRKLSHCGTRFSWSNIYGNEILCLALEFGIRVGDTWPEQRFQGMDCFRGGKFVLVKFALSDARRCITSWLKIIISRESFRWDARKGDENAQFFDKIRFVLFASWID